MVKIILLTWSKLWEAKWRLHFAKMKWGLNFASWVLVHVNTAESFHKYSNLCSCEQTGHNQMEVSFCKIEMYPEFHFSNLFHVSITVSWFSKISVHFQPNSTRCTAYSKICYKKLQLVAASVTDTFPLFRVDRLTPCTEDMQSEITWQLRVLTKVLRFYEINIVLPTSKVSPFHPYLPDVFWNLSRFASRRPTSPHLSPASRSRLTSTFLLVPGARSRSTSTVLLSPFTCSPYTPNHLPSISLPFTSLFLPTATKMGYIASYPFGAKASASRSERGYMRQYDVDLYVLENSMVTQVYENVFYAGIIYY